MLVELDPGGAAREPATTTASTWPSASAAIARYSEEQLELLLEFTREGRELNEREAAKLEGQALRGARRWALRESARPC